MIVPMDLYSLVQRKGYLSPEMAIGWKIGTYVAEYFDDLSDVGVAAVSDNDAVLALLHLIQGNGYPGRIVVPKSARPWDFLFYHLTTGTQLSFTLIRKRTELPQKIRELEAELCEHNHDELERYQASLDFLIKSILREPVTSFSLIRQSRCRRLHIQNEEGHLIHCHHCGSLIPPDRAWDVEGDICCLSCAGLEPVWGIYH